MGATLDCPECGRRLTAPMGTDAVICDGCERMFDPASIPQRRAPLWKKGVGIGLIVLGGLSFVATLAAGPPRPIGGDTDAAIRFGGSLLFSGLLIAWGRSMTKGKAVVGPDRSD